MNKTSFEEIEENNLDGLFMSGANPDREYLLTIELFVHGVG